MDVAESSHVGIVSTDVGICIVGSTLGSCEAGLGADRSGRLQKVCWLLAHGKCMQLKYVLRNALLLV